MNIYFPRIKWSSNMTPIKFELSMNYYIDYRELQFDLRSSFEHKVVFSNLPVEAAKQIRDRLNDFIKAVEGEPMPSVNPPEPK